MTAPNPQPANEIDAVVEDPLWEEAIGDPAALANECRAAAVAIEPALDGAAALLFSNDAALAQLNADFRGKPKPTNVLAFPSGDAAPGFLGDIALARETCLQEAAALNKPVRDHAAHLIVHGLLHLIGLDHQTEEEAAEMERMETAILARLGVAAPYADDHPNKGAAS